MNVATHNHRFLLPHEKVGKAFLLAGLCCLSLGLLFGFGAALQYVFPTLLKGQLDFFQNRPLHVTLVTGWIFLSAKGYIYSTMGEKENRMSASLGWIHLGLFLLTAIAACISYFFRSFGGREYMEYPPVISIPLFLGWIVFAINFFKTLFRLKKKQPVYIWMWGTGILFFLLTFTEAHLWMLPWFRNNLIRDLTVQWKSYGALVGSWNMLVYGTAISLMSKIGNDGRYARSRMGFLLFFLGFTNLLFGWGHHTYPVPAQIYIRYIAFGISMTELLILGKMMFDFMKEHPASPNCSFPLSRRLLASADLWVFANLALALLISVPVINLFTHGTHITVAHAMGTTIGINSTLLFAAHFYLLKGQNQPKKKSWTLILLNFSLAFFLVCLCMAGIEKGYWMQNKNGISFSEMQLSLRPWFIGMAIFGAGIFATLISLIAKLFRENLR